MGEHTKKIIDLPGGLNLSTVEMQALGNFIIDYVVQRTRRGHGKGDKPWRGKAGKYSEGYKKSADFAFAGKGDTVDLTLSLSMLNAIEILDREGSNTLEFGISDDNPNEQKAEGNILGTYGRGSKIPGKARPFLDVTRKEVLELTEDFLGEPLSERVSRDTAFESILAEFTN